jgi:hypothetical protein
MVVPYFYRMASMMNDSNQHDNEGEYAGMDRPLIKTTFWLGFVVCIIAIVYIAFGCSPARASASECEFIKDSDERHFCRAGAKNQPSECEFIKNSDKRHICRAKFSQR